MAPKFDINAYRDITLIWKCISSTPVLIEYSRIGQVKKIYRYFAQSSPKKNVFSIYFCYVEIKNIAYVYIHYFM